MKNYTVVGLCLCGCEDAVIMDMTGKDADNAAERAAVKRAARGMGTKVLAVMDQGENYLPNPVTFKA